MDITTSAEVAGYSDVAFNIFMASVALLALKMAALALITVALRTKTKTFTLAEDAKAFKGEVADTDVGGVERARRAQRNDVENNVAFFILAFLYVLTEPPVAYVQSYCYTYVIARYLHSVFFLAKLQPWRSLAFVVGLLANIGLAVQLLMKAFG